MLGPLPWPEPTLCPGMQRQELVTAPSSASSLAQEAQSPTGAQGRGGWALSAQASLLHTSFLNGCPQLMSTQTSTDQEVEWQDSRRGQVRMTQTTLDGWCIPVPQTLGLSAPRVRG